MKLLLLCGLAAVCVLAQELPPSDAPPLKAYQTIRVWNTTKEVARCWSPSLLPNRADKTVSISAASNAAAVVMTSNAHGFDTTVRPKITISGGTGNWAAVNGTFVATPTGANTFTIPVDSTTFGAVTGTLVFTTTAPRTTVAEWAVQVYGYDGSANQVSKAWLNATTGFNQKCSDATLTTVNAQ